MPITVGSLQTFDYAGGASPTEVDSTVDVGTGGAARVLYVGGCGRNGYPTGTVLDPGGADEIIGTLYGQDHSEARGSGVLTVIIPPWISGTHTLRTSFLSGHPSPSVHTVNLRVWARVLNGVNYIPVGFDAVADPTYPFAPTCELGVLSAGDLVIANGNNATANPAQFGDWSASTETLAMTGSVDYSGSFYYVDGILNGVTGGVPFQVTPTGDQIGSAAAIAFTAADAMAVVATAALSEDDDSTATVSPIVVTYLGSTTGIADNPTPHVISDSIDIGAADFTRQIIGVLHTGGDMLSGVNSFAGVTPTLDIFDEHDAGGFCVSIMRALVPSGSGAQTLSVGLAAGFTGYSFDWYSVTGANTTLTDVDSTGDNSPLTVTLDSVDDGLLMVGMVRVSSGPSLGDEYDFTHSYADGAFYTTSGYDALVTPGPTVVTDLAGGAGSVLAAISLEPLVVGATAEIIPGDFAVEGLGVWTGSAWEEKPALVWTGSAWEQKPVKHWNGSAWV